MEAVHGGEIVDVHALVMSFPFSNTAFAVPMLSENQECFLAGLQLLFDQCGGVPLSIRIDNLTPAVKRPRDKQSEAVLTDEFLAFQGHYGFEVQVCNPRSGHEKGNVERKVGYIRYNFFSVPPIIDSLEDLEEKLKKKLIEDHQREHYQKEQWIDDLWVEETAYLLAFADQPKPMNEQVDQLCKHLRLAYIADVYEEIPFENPTDFLLQLLKVEKDGREKAKAERNIKKARFLEYKTLEQYEWHKDICLPSRLDRQELESLRFIERKENLILVGHPVQGKHTSLQHSAEELVKKDMMSAFIAWPTL